MDQVPNSTNQRGSFGSNIGIPIAWFIMNRWLSGYGHRISLHWWIFLAAGAVVAIIAAVSVLYQSIKTARTNPAEALKKE